MDVADEEDEDIDVEKTQTEFYDAL